MTSVADKPNLVIQLQRMGDLVLSFPLLSWLGQLEPEHPLWVVAEPHFSSALMPLAPSAVLFAPEFADRLRRVAFHRVINLSHRPDAALLAGSMQAESRLGVWTRNGENHVEGVWRLYRTALVHNNRHNRMHWADLNALDVLQPYHGQNVLRRSQWPRPRPPAGTGRIGLFVGASEADKRPEPRFWADLAMQLLRRGHRPVFLGGPADTPLGTEAARLAGIPRANLCGLFQLEELVRFMAELDLLVTPDTGPMHVGAWAGALTLNLSMGPVNAWETAPFPPGHLVLRPSISCTGCWRCERNAATPPCKTLFVPERTASLIHAILRGENRPPVPPGLILRKTRRSGQGLFDLAEQADTPPTPRETLGEWWKQWFLERLGGPTSTLPEAGRDLQTRHPRALALMRGGLPRLQAQLSAGLRRGSLDRDCWRHTPPVLRPVSGYIQMMLENDNFSRQAWRAALEHLEHLAAALTES